MNDVYCPLPFKHAFIEPRGIKPCCSYAGEYKETIESWSTGESLKEIQQDILNGRINHGCAACLKNEKVDGISTRLGAIKDYNNEYFTKTEIDYIDYRSSNICNFRCRSCEPFYSNGIAFDVKRNPVLQQFYPQMYISKSPIVPEGKVAPTLVDDYQWILNNIGRIRKLMFTGGEPTKIPEVRKIIDYIIDNDIRNVHILITSNASFVDEYWLDITAKLPNIHWTLSLDAIGNAAEIIRDGTIWDIVSFNIERLFDISPSVNIGTVITNLNVLNLHSLFTWVNKLSNKYQHRHNGRTQFIAVCNWPKRMSPYNWPENLKSVVLRYLNSINTADLVDQQPGCIESLIENIKNHCFDSILWNESEEYNNILDQLRNQDHQQLYNPNYGI